MLRLTPRFLLTVSFAGLLANSVFANPPGIAGQKPPSEARNIQAIEAQKNTAPAINPDVYVSNPEATMAQVSQGSPAKPGTKGNLASPQKQDIIVPPPTPVQATVPGKGKKVSNLNEALVESYLTNPDINAQRYQVRAQDEGVAVAKSGYRPRLNLNGSTAWNRKRLSGDPIDQDPTRNPNRTTTHSSGADVTLKQNILQGGKTVADTNAAKSTVMLERARLDAIEQKILLETVTAYADVINSKAQLDLQHNNQEFLTKNLEATQAKFDVGEETRTSLAQSKADQVEAIAKVQQALSQLESKGATFTKVTGFQVSIPLGKPNPPTVLPKTLKEAVALALENNPNIKAAKFELEVARFGVDQARSGLLPSLDLTGSVGKSWDHAKYRYRTPPLNPLPYNFNSRSRTVDYSAGAQLTVPIYEAGEFRARQRQAHEIVEVKRVVLETTTRQVIENLTFSWNKMVAANQNIKEYNEQVESNRVSLEGTAQEVAVGSKIILDYLNAQRRLVEATSNYINAERDYLVSCYEVLAGIGYLTVDRLGLNVGRYNAVPHYKDTKDRWF